MLHHVVLEAVALLSVLWLVFFVRKRRLRDSLGLPFPPGPKPLPLIGNLRDLPLRDGALVYNQWARKYGALVHANVLGRHLLFVNSAQVARDLFEKRSANYSDRALSPMINELMGWDWSFGHMRYGERWKRYRRMFESRFRASMATNYRPTQVEAARALLRKLLGSPEEALFHLRHYAARAIMKVVYGIDVAERNDVYVDIAEAAINGMAQAATPGAFLVEILPFLKYVPAWMPGASFKRRAAEWKRFTLEMRDAPFQAVQEAISRGTAVPCFVSDIMNDINLTAKDDDMETLKGCAGLAYAAGGESIVSSLSSFILAMVLYPDIQKKAQQELDSVIGRGRLPEFTDRPSLPYIDSIVKETIRWNPVAPLGLPHMVTSDDIYNGYFIRAGTIIIGNTWTMLHDEKSYPEPFAFHPERFLDTYGKGNAAPDPATAAFGYGRRICPGRWLSDAQLWISIASMLAVFNIGPGLDEHGQIAKAEAAFVFGMISHPRPFRCSIKPRDDAAASLIISE